HDLAVGVREEPERELVLRGELRVRRGAVGRNAEDDDARAPELSPEVPEPAGLLRAPGGVVRRIEIADDVRAPALRQRHTRPGTVLQREGRGLAPLHDLRHGSPRPRPGRTARGPRRVQEDGAALSRLAGVTGLVPRARSSAAVVAGRPVTAAARAAARSAGSR